MPVAVNGRLLAHRGLTRMPTRTLFGWPNLVKRINCFLVWRLPGLAAPPQPLRAALAHWLLHAAVGTGSDRCCQMEVQRSVESLSRSNQAGRQDGVDGVLPLKIEFLLSFYSCMGQLPVPGTCTSYDVLPQPKQCVFD